MKIYRLLFICNFA